MSTNPTPEGVTEKLSIAAGAERASIRRASVPGPWMQEKRAAVPAVKPAPAEARESTTGSEGERQSGRSPLDAHLEEAERKAWESLARYKFQMFGYWSAIWVHLNRISGQRRPNPWASLVQHARKCHSE